MLRFRPMGPSQGPEQTLNSFLGARCVIDADNPILVRIATGIRNPGTESGFGILPATLWCGTNKQEPRPATSGRRRDPLCATVARQMALTPGCSIDQASGLRTAPAVFFENRI